MTIRKLALGAMGALALCASAAQATVTQFTMSIDGLQEVPPNATPAFGTGTATYDDVSGVFSWNITYSDLLGSVTVAHFHGPAAPGATASPVITLNPISPIIDSTVITPLQAADLLNELWYVNIHSTFDSSGEIRGQVLVVPEPASLFLLGLGGFAALRRR